MEAVFLFSLLVSAVVFGALGTVIAQNKGVSLTAGFWWGCLLGPIGLIVVALLNPEPKASISIKTSDRFSAVDGVEYDTSNDSYRLWLVRKYGIEKNDTLGKFIVGTSVLNDLEEAISLADSLERADIEAVKQSRIAQERAHAEAEQVTRSQRDSNRRDFEKLKKRLLGYLPTTARVLPIIVVVAALALFSIDMIWDSLANRSYNEFNEKLVPFGIEINIETKKASFLKRRIFQNNIYSVERVPASSNENISAFCNYDIIIDSSVGSSRPFDYRPVATDGTLFKIAFPFEESAPQARYYYMKEFLNSGYEINRDKRADQFPYFNEGVYFNYKSGMFVRMKTITGGAKSILNICFGKFKS